MYKKFCENSKLGNRANQLLMKETHQVRKAFDVDLIETKNNRLELLEPVRCRWLH